MNPFVMASLISGGSSLLGGLFGNAQQSQMNAEMMQWQEEMWNKQNEYNTPLNQRLRLQAGGFNPNLVYGTGTIANTAGSVGSPPTPVKNQLNIGDAINGALQTYMQGKQLDQNQEQIDLAKEKFEQQKYMDYFKQANIAADTLLKGMSTETGAFKLGVDKELRQNTLEMAYENLKSLKQQVQQSKGNYDFLATMRPFEYKIQGEKAKQSSFNTQSSRWDADIKKSQAFEEFIQANNLPAFTRIRLQKAVQEYKLAYNQDNRQNTQMALNKIRVMLENERLKKDEIQAFFNILKSLR